MKKILSLTMALTMLGTALTGCGSKDAATKTPAENTRQEQSQTEKALALINTFATGLNAALGALAEQGISIVYDDVHMVLAQGNFVLAVSEGTFGGTPTSYYDLWRVENGKIAEH